MSQSLFHFQLLWTVLPLKNNNIIAKAFIEINVIVCQCNKHILSSLGGGGSIAGRKTENVTSGKTGGPLKKFVKK